MTRNKIINLLKWFWIVVVLIGAGYYLYKNFREISQYFSYIKIDRLILAFVFLSAGKLLISDLTRLSLKKIDQKIPYRDAVSISSVTQLGKYLPGGIWHFAGKFGVYKARDISTKQATQAMIWENAWLFTSAIVVGVFSILLTGETVICDYIPFLCTRGLSSIFLIIIPVLWIIALIIFERLLFRKKILILDFLLTVVEQASSWILFGLSLWIIFPISNTLLSQVVGAFSVSWVAGYAAVFAPGGIGIRELVLAVMLRNAFSSQEIAAYASVHRIIWILVELILGAATAILFGISTGDGISCKSDENSNNNGNNP